MADEEPRCSVFESIPTFITDRFTAGDLLVASFLAGVLAAGGIAAFFGDASVVGFAVTAVLYTTIIVLFAALNEYRGIETVTGDVDG